MSRSSPQTKIAPRVARDSPLLAAVFAGDVEAALAALALGGEADSPGSAIGPALMAAAHLGREELVEILLARGADPNAATPEGVTACRDACLAGRLGCLRLLIAAGAGPLAGPAEGVGPMLAACLGDHDDCVAALLACGASVDQIHVHFGESIGAAAYCVATGSHKCLRLLLSAGADPMALSHGEPAWLGGVAHPCLHRACWVADSTAAAILLDHGADPTWADAQGRDALAICEESAADDCAGIVRGRLAAIRERAALDASAARAFLSDAARRI